MLERSKGRISLYNNSKEQNVFKLRRSRFQVALYRLYRYKRLRRRGRGTLRPGTASDLHISFCRLPVAMPVIALLGLQYGSLATSRHSVLI
jgi:hypothetical protein